MTTRVRAGDGSAPVNRDAREPGSVGAHTARRAGSLRWLRALLGIALVVCTGPSHAAATCVDAGCHGSLLKAAHVHAPVADGCEGCHEALGTAHPDSTRADFRLLEQDGALCGQCHEAFPGKMTRHAPVSEGQCLTCHDPHASARPKLLRLALNDLCFECHDRGAFKVHAVVGVDIGGSHPLSGPTDPARKGERFTCVSCHDPHATDSPSLWRFGVQEPFELCGKCHAK